MEWEGAWEMATCQGKGMKTSRNHVPVCKGFRDLYLWWPAWGELWRHKCVERPLPAVVIHPLKSPFAQSSAACGAQMKKFCYKYTEVPT